MPTEVTFSVIGEPAPKGSAKAFVVGGKARIANMSAKREKPWAQAVHWTAREHAPEKPWEGPIGVEITFTMPRPGRLGKRATGVRCDKRPDLDKLARSALDALTGVFFVDDSQVARLRVSKMYADPGEASGARFYVTRLEVAS